MIRNINNFCAFELLCHRDVEKLTDFYFRTIFHWYIDYLCLLQVKTVIEPTFQIRLISNNSYINILLQIIIISKVEMKQCYYQLLEVDRKATAAQIKTNYRKMALKYHPDKNPTEDGRKMFLLITQAYQVLSDPNERTWYDNNREKILFNKDQMSKEDLQMFSFGFNIWSFFTSACFKGFDDTEGSFYQVYRNVFEKIKAEEVKAFAMRQDKQQEQMRKYEGFGDSTTIINRVLQFYDDWENFTTYKTFVWVDQWDTREAHNRYIKRQMQKQNKKQRQKEKKNYIKTIKDLVSFLKKRDPRYRQYLIQQKKKEEERQLLKKQKQQQKKKQKQQMKKIKQQLQQQRFRQIEQYYKKQQGSEQKKNYSSQQDYAQFYCKICAKQFKSQNQLRNHQNSKLHKQNVKQLQKEVMTKQQIITQVKKQVQKEQVKQEPEKKPKKNRKKNKNKNNDVKQSEEQQKQIETKDQTTFNPKEKQAQVQSKQETKQTKVDQKNTEVGKNKKKKKQNNKKNEEKNSQQQVIEPPKKQKEKVIQKKVQTDSEDDTDAFMNAMLNKKKPANIVQVEKKQQNKVQQKKGGKQVAKKVQSSQQSEESGDQQRKKGKAKIKRQKKQANKQKQTGFKCNVCNQSFPSKSKLFDHINKTGHAKAK